MAKKAIHNKNFAKVKKFYDNDLWNEARVRNAATHPASNPWITAAEYEEITGQPYEAPAEAEAKE